MDYEKKKPFGEWRLPIMVLTLSSLIFILLTAAFGVTINSSTRKLDFHMGIQDTDPFETDPMQQYPDWIYACMVFGYYSCVGIFIYCWYDYNKWKWNNIPKKERIEYKTVRIKIPDNSLYRVEMLNKKKV